MEREIICPSGLRGTIRSLKVRDEQLFTDPKLRRDNGQLLAAVLERCWVRTLDPGPYALTQSGQLNWSRLLQGDAYYAFLQIRIQSYGKDYEFRYTCDACRRPARHTVDLETFPMRPLSPEAIVHVQSGTPFVATVAGRRFAYRLLRVEDYRGIDMLRENRRLSIRAAAIVARVQEIEGVDRHPSNIIRFVEELDGADFSDLEAAVEQQEGGVDTLVDLDCEHCYAVTEVPLPFGPTFFRKVSVSPTAAPETGSAG